MIGWGFTLHGATSNPARSVKPTSSVLNGRTLTSSFAASPRISYRSTWWAAIKQRGFAGWRQLIRRNMAERNMTEAERSAKTKQVKSDISDALKWTRGKAEEWRKNFNQILRNAAWYEVDVDAQIRCAFQMMTEGELIALRKTCGSDHSLKFLINKIAERVAEIGVFKDQFQGNFFKSAMLYSEGYLLEGWVQSKQWRKIDSLVVSYGNLYLADNVANAIAKSDPWKLLPFAENHCKKVPTTSPALEEFCRQAFKKIKNSEIQFNDLSDVELAKFSELFKDAELSHHASACAAVIKERLHTARCNALALHLEKHVSLIISSQIGSFKNIDSVSENALFEGLTDHAISVALKVIAKLDPEVVVKLSKLESELFAHTCLINAAKAYLAWPDVRTMENGHLNAYLRLSPGVITEKARELLVGEAKDRTKEGLSKCFEVLMKGLESKSCYELVHAVREFSTLADNIAKIKDAASFGKGLGDIPTEFSTALEELDSNSIMRARVLITGLVQHGEAHVANLLITAIKEKCAGAFVQLTSGYDPFMAEAIAHYFPAAGIAVQSGAADPVYRNLGPKLLDFFEDKCLVDGSFRKVRTSQGKEMPVCENFVKDQRGSMHEVNGNPVFNSHLSKNIDKAREFVRKMSSLKKISEEQILMASRIATQSTAQSFLQLAAEEKLFPLTSAEAQKLCTDATGGWLLLAGLRHSENFVMQEDGSLIAHVRIFGENIKDWSGEVFTPGGVVPILAETVPEETSVSVELRFEINADGKITECVMESFTCNWAFATPAGF